MNADRQARLTSLRAYRAGIYDFVTDEGVNVECGGRNPLIETNAPYLATLRNDPALFLAKIREIEEWAFATELEVRESEHAPGCDLSHPYSYYSPCLPNPEPDIETKSKAGTVYLVRSQIGYYKIGITRGPVERRISTLQNATASTLELTLSFVTNDCEAAEQYLHQRFANRNIRGEWFALTEADIAEIKAFGELK